MEHEEEQPVRAEPEGRQSKRAAFVVLRVLGVLAVIAYPVVVYVGLQSWSLAALGLVLVGVAVVVALVRLPRLRAAGWWGILQAPLIVAALVLLGVLLDDPRYLLALPVLINLGFLVSFGLSLRSERPMVERLARLIQPTLPPAEVAYCRQVTKVWCVFFVANGSVALVLALWAPLAWWTLYNGMIAYVLVGALFTVEYIVRKIRFRRYSRWLPDRLLARFFPAPPASTDE